MVESLEALVIQLSTLRLATKVFLLAHGLAAAEAEDMMVSEEQADKAPLALVFMEDLAELAHLMVVAAAERAAHLHLVVQVAVDLLGQDL